MNKILFIGLGNMGLPLYNLFKGQGGELYYHTTEQKEGFDNFQEVKDINEATWDIIVLVCKPQNLDDIFHKIKLNEDTKKNCLILSIMAGVSCKNIESITGIKNIVRAMPNMAITYGKSITGLYFNKNCLQNDNLNEQISLVNKIFKKSGIMKVVEYENHLHQWTAFFGSGIGFVMDIMNSYQKEITRQIDITNDEARELVQVLFQSAIEYSQENETLEVLRNKIVSKGGTTNAGLNVLSDAFRSLINKTIGAAIDRSQELEKGGT